MQKSTLRSQSGFSLVELMVVVAIIGVLAAMSAGQVQKQIAKARQAEAKTNLATAYTAMKAYQSEYGAYSTYFEVIKLAYEGQLRYQTGFNNGVAKPASDTSTTAGTNFRTSGFCGADGVFANGCSVMKTNGVTPATTNGTASSATAFYITANANIYDATNNDQWAMDQNKNLTHPADGIP